MWDIRYRPVRFSDVLGQQGTVQLLKARVKNGTSLDTSYIFSGGSGQGKTTLARILARAALCQDVDRAEGEPCNVCEQCVAILQGDPSAFEERDAASGGAIDIVRGMLAELPFMPPMGALKRVWLFDEAHRLSLPSQDALLKALEEKKFVGMFCTTEAEKIRGPIRGRCEEYLIRRVTREDVLARMKLVLVQEKVEHEDDAVLTVIDHSGGHIRDVLVKLEMISQMGAVTMATVREYLSLSSVSLYYDILLSLGDAQAALQLIDQACDQASPEDVSAGIAEAAMNSFRLANNMFTDFTYVDKDRALQVYQRFGVSVVKLADYFVRSRAVSKVNLYCDVLNLVQNSGAAPAPAVSQAPVVLAVSAPVVAASAPTSQPAPSPVATSTPTTAPASLPSPISPVLSAPTGNGKLRSDGVGPLGSGDIRALTEEDHKAVPMEFPRRSGSSKTVPLNFDHNSADEMAKPITPEEWKREFTRTWPGRVS